MWLHKVVGVTAPLTFSNWVSTIYWRARRTSFDNVVLKATDAPCRKTVAAVLVQVFVVILSASSTITKKIVHRQEPELGDSL